MRATYGESKLIAGAAHAEPRTRGYAGRDPTPLTETEGVPHDQRRPGPRGRGFHGVHQRRREARQGRAPVPRRPDGSPGVRLREHRPLRHERDLRPDRGRDGQRRGTDRALHQGQGEGRPERGRRRRPPRRVRGAAPVRVLRRGRLVVLRHRHDHPHRHDHRRRRRRVQRRRQLARHRGPRHVRPDDRRRHDPLRGAARRRHDAPGDWPRPPAQVRHHRAGDRDRPREEGARRPRDGADHGRRTSATPRVGRPSPRRSTRSSSARSRSTSPRPRSPSSGFAWARRPCPRRRPSPRRSARSTSRPRATSTTVADRSRTTHLGDPSTDGSPSCVPAGPRGRRIAR